MSFLNAVRAAGAKHHKHVAVMAKAYFISNYLKKKKSFVTDFFGRANLNSKITFHLARPASLL